MPDGGRSPTRLDAFYLPMGEARRFCVLHEPEKSGATGESVLYVHPFAEEMNRSRRMAALQSRALAGAGFTVLQIDLAGCGDSDGEFADASWERWVSDVCEAAQWLSERTGRAPWLWGLREGGLVAAESARKMSPSPNLLFWNPVLSGTQFLQQFLRLKVVAQIVGSAGTTRVDTRELRERLMQGTRIEVAGYELSPALAHGLDAAVLSPVPGNSGVVWMEVANASDGKLSPAAHARVEAWRNAGHAVDARSISGQPFWQTQEIAECPELIKETLAALTAVRP